MTRPGQDGRVDALMRKLDSQPPAADVVLDAVLLDRTGTRRHGREREISDGEARTRTGDTTIQKAECRAFMG